MVKWNFVKDCMRQHCGLHAVFFLCNIVDMHLLHIHRLLITTMVNRMFVILRISWEPEPSLGSKVEYTTSILVGRYSVHYIEKSLSLCRLDFSDRRHVKRLPSKQKRTDFEYVN